MITTPPRSGARGRLQRARSLGAGLCLLAASCTSPPESTELAESEIIVTGPADVQLDTPSACGSTPAGRLTIGSIFPEGNVLGAPGRIAAASLAIESVNAGGGVFGQPVEHLVRRTTAGDITSTVEELIKADADALLTGVGSADGLKILDQIEEVGLLQISPNQTAGALQSNDEYGVYFRTAPSDFIQARVLSDALNDDDEKEIAVLYRDDAYGNGLLRALRTNFEFGEKRIRSLAFQNEDTEFETLLAEFLGNDAQTDALVVIGYDEETKEILRAIGPDARFDIWGVDGNTGVYSLLDSAEKNLMIGFRQTVPSPDPSDERVEDFYDEVRTRADNQNPPLSFTAETYDSVIIVALAAIAAQCDDPRLIAAEINDVTREGITCSSFEDCRTLLEQSRDIDFDGLAGLYDFLDEGEPSVGGYRIDTYGLDGRDLSKAQFETREYCQICLLNESRIFFEHASHELGPEDRRSLDDVAKSIKEKPEMGPIEIQGFASPDGDPLFNLELSKDRAEEVRSYLIDQGVGAERLLIRGFGSTDQMPQDRVVLFAEPSADG